MDIRHLNQVQLARRWSLSPRTLERWRWLRQGPRYLKIGGRVLYRLEDVEEYEATQINTTGEHSIRAGSATDASGALRPDSQLHEQPHPITARS
jgi:hypothetical protein